MVISRVHFSILLYFVLVLHKQILCIAPFRSNNNENDAVSLVKNILVPIFIRIKYDYYARD